MYRKLTSILGVVILLAIVGCLSLLIVGGVVTWMAAQEGTSLGELASGLFQISSSTRSGLAVNTPRADLLPQASPTPFLIVAATPQEANTSEPTPSGSLPPATEPAAAVAALPATPTPAPASAPQPAEETQIEAVIESPIRAGSPLPEHPASRLVIQAMDLDIPVILAPIKNQTWQVEHLGKEFVGHLEGTASPGDSSNVVLAGHVTIAHNVYGPFAGLGNLNPGDSIVIYDGERSYTYSVDYRQLVDRTAVDVTYPTNTGRVTLITCSNWSDELGAYQERLIVVGHLMN